MPDTSGYARLPNWFKFTLGSSTSLGKRHSDTFTVTLDNETPAAVITHSGSALVLPMKRDLPAERRYFMRTIWNMTRDWDEKYLPSANTLHCEGFVWDITFESDHGERLFDSCGIDAIGPAGPYCSLLKIIRAFDPDFGKKASHVWSIYQAMCFPDPIRYRPSLDACTRGSIAMSIGIEYLNEMDGLSSASDLEENLHEARRWFAKGSELGDIESLVLLGRSNLLGNPDEEDTAAACEYLSRASNAGNAEGTFLLGDLIAREHNLAEQKLFMTYKLACEQLKSGDLPQADGGAYLRLGRCLERGIGCKQNVVDAHGCYERASFSLGIACRGGMNWCAADLIEAREGAARTASI